MSIRVEFMLNELESEIPLNGKREVVRRQLEDADREGRVVELFRGNSRIGFFTYQVQYADTIPNILFANGYIHPHHRHPHNFIRIWHQFRSMYKDGLFTLDSRRRQKRRNYVST